MNDSKLQQKNRIYETEKLAQYFATNRITWEQFYDSEKAIIELLRLNKDHHVLDIGCGCGGLGLALKDKFNTENYTGVEINELSAQTGRGLNSKARIYTGDILNISQDELKEKQFDVVFSLSCVDWNIEFSKMLAAAWQHVKPGGYLVVTFRLTDGDDCIDFDRSYQYINNEGKLEGEKAAYVVLNANSLLQKMLDFNPLEINANGYWGSPSATAVTPYQTLCFSAFSIRKRLFDVPGKLKYELDLPEEIVKIMKTS